MTNAVVLEGFNLLPYRFRKRRENRRRRVALLAAASLAGCAAVGVVAGWDAWQRGRIDERRVALETSLRASNAQRDEHARLLRAEAERRQAREKAQPLAAPRDRFLALLEALADAPQQPGIALQRVTQRADEVELAALAPDSQTASRWLKRLERLRGVQAVEVVEMKRRVEAPSSSPSPAKRDAAATRVERYEFTALVRYAAAPSTLAARGSVNKTSTTATGGARK